MSTHTPTPWTVDPAGIIGANRETVVTRVPLMDDAFHIVACVNSHDALLAACRAVLECELCHDENGHAYLKVPARSLGDLGASIRAIVNEADGQG